MPRLHTGLLGRAFRAESHVPPVRGTVHATCADLWMPYLLLCKLPVLILILTLLWALPVQAAPSCGLEKWLANLNTAANAYVSALKSPDQISAERGFRAQMERYTRQQLIDQINEANLGANKNSLESFILARRHLYDLARDDWSEMAARFGGDDRFAKQSQSMTAFLQETECDPFAEDFLNQTTTQKTIRERIQGALTSLTNTPESMTDTQDAPSDLLFDPDDFDDFRAARYTPQQKPSTIPLSPSQNAPIFLGLFTFIVSTSIWVWMQVGIAQRRAIRYPCNLPVVIFDGSAPILGELRDISQRGAKLETGLKVPVKAKIMITINATKCKARVSWTNQHFIGIQFDKHLSEADMEDLLGPFSDQVAAAHEVSGGIETLVDNIYGTSAVKLSDHLSRSGLDSEIDGITIKNVYAPKTETDVQDHSDKDQLTEENANNTPEEAISVKDEQTKTLGTPEHPTNATAPITAA